MQPIYYIIIITVLFIIALAIVRANKKDFKLEINKLVELLGGKDNIIDTEVEMSRFKVTLKDVSKANKDGIMKLGAKGVVEIDDQLKIIFGKDAKRLKRYIDEALEKKLNSVAKTDLNTVSGVDNLIDILGNVDRTTEKGILGFIEEHNKLLSEKIKAGMFVFEDIVKVDNMGIQKVLKEVQVKDLACALKNAPEEVQDVIFGNQSARAQESLKEEIELLGPIKNSKIEDAQQKIVSVIKRLEAEGLIEIDKGNDE